MKRKTALILLSVIALMLCGCKEKNGPEIIRSVFSEIVPELEK